MPITSGIRLADNAVKEMKIWLAMNGVYLLMIGPLLVVGTRALTAPQPIENRVFGVIVTSLFTLLAIIVLWKSILFAVHVKCARFLDDEVVIERVMAPQVRVPYLSGMKKFVTAVPCWNAPYYQRGTLFFCGALTFYVSDYLPEARLLVDRFLSETQNGNP